MSRRCAATVNEARRFAVLVACCCGALGCAASLAVRNDAGKREVAGNPDAPPTLAALPELTQRASGNTERTHQGMLLTREALDAGLPQPPADRSYAALQRWAETQVADWVRKRRAQTSTMRERMFLEGEPSAGERVVSHALLALLYEDTAHSLRDLPLPNELVSDPEIAQMYREVVAAEAESFSTSAVLELRDCANLGYRGPSDMRPFALYCHARFDRLQAEARARNGKNGEHPEAAARATALAQ